MINDKCLRILVVDDTAVYRMIMSEILSGLPGVEVVGTAHNGKAAMSRIAVLKPNLLVLDIMMPEMDGLEVLNRIKTEARDVGAIMLSAASRDGGDITMKALELGAFDFIPKPETGSLEENKKAIKNTIGPMLKAFARQKEIKSILSKIPPSPQTRPRNMAPGDGQDVIQRMKSLAGHTRQKSKAVAIGISTGGPKALGEMMPALPPDLGVPIFIAQHMPPVFTRSLANKLDSECALRVKEAQDGEPAIPNTVYIAPGGKQMKVAGGADQRSKIVRITNDPPENSCRPSADYLFRSIALHYGGRATGVIMTGMGSDGTLGLKLMKEKGATVIAQDEKTCVVYGMPKESAEAEIVDVIAPLNRIAQEICRTVKG
ncbi:MAG: chemotaxis response regulator protein-glutamate methylesterase [Thermodesulfobacteriota bacterium]|nr:chemotaxis response regulator protein-glutamate methylesterase [Thermodesulfobacteriota bacterium]